MAEKKIIPMTLELKDTTLKQEGGAQWAHFSLIVRGGEVATLKGWSEVNRRALMAVVWGIIPLDEGFVSIDGEPVTVLSAPYLRRWMAYLPAQVRWADEERNVIPMAEQRRQLLQEIVGRQPRLLLIEDMTDEELPVCRQLAEQGTAVVVFQR